MVNTIRSARFWGRFGCRRVFVQLLDKKRHFSGFTSRNRHFLKIQVFFVTTSRNRHFWCHKWRFFEFSWTPPFGFLSKSSIFGENWISCRGFCEAESGKHDKERAVSGSFWVSPSLRSTFGQKTSFFRIHL